MQCLGEGYCKHEYTVALQQFTCISVQVVMKPIHRYFYLFNLHTTKLKNAKKTTTKKPTNILSQYHRRVTETGGRSISTSPSVFPRFGTPESGSLRQMGGPEDGWCWCAFPEGSGCTVFLGSTSRSLESDTHI